MTFEVENTDNLQEWESKSYLYPLLEVAPGDRTTGGLPVPRLRVSISSLQAAPKSKPFVPSSTHKEL